MVDPIWHSLFHAIGFGIAAAVLFQMFARLPAPPPPDTPTSLVVVAEAYLLTMAVICGALFLVTVAQA